MSPSIPTQALAANEDPETPAGLLGVGTVKRAETELKVCPAGGAVKIAPAQFVDSRVVWVALPVAMASVRRASLASVNFRG